MLHLKNSLIVLGMLLLFTTSCEKDFTTVGNQLIEQPHFDGKLYTDAKVKVYDQRVDKVFATNLPTHAIGIYNDPVFGRLEADLVSAVQIKGVSSAISTTLELSSISDGFGDNIKILNAKLIIPYFSHEETGPDGNKEYIVDSVYGQSPFEIKIYENSYLLPGLDPNTDLSDKRSFYSDFDFDPFKTTLLADSIHFRTDFSPYITYKREADGTYSLDDDNQKIVQDSLAPHFVMPLDTTFFRTKIFDHSGEDIISNTQKFQDYFRGINIDAVAENNDGKFLQLNTADAQIIVAYTQDYPNDHGTSDTSDDTIDILYKELHISLDAPKVNTYTNYFNTNMQTAIDNSDEINGDNKVFIKGDAGSETIITLFDNNQLSELKSNDWMINQAELILYVDDATVNNTLLKTQRLLLYDFDSKKYLIDVYAPENTTTGNAFFGGMLKEDDNGNSYYSFKITRHIREIIKYDNQNVRLGLRVTPYINTENVLLRNDIFYSPDSFNPSGTILYGNQTTVLDKKPILKIYYTDPE